MPKPKTEPAATAAADTTSASAPQASPPAPMPTSGGCWVRLADGSLVPDPTEHPTPATTDKD